MAADLFSAVINDRTRSVNFFNGRLLSAEDLTSEQKSNRVAHGLLGQAIGHGVVHGMEVTESVLSSTATAPVLMVTKGAAINRRGGMLLLAEDTEVSLVRPADSSASATPIFQSCAPPQTGAYVAGAGVYLLTVSPASASEGMAEVSGVSTARAACNSNYNACGVQFRILQLQIDASTMGDPAHLQNAVAYLCFGCADWSKERANPLGGPFPSFGLLDQLRATQLLTDCEVPLAVLYWTATGGLVFVDMWSVRRRLTKAGENSSFPLFVNDRPESVSDGMFLQFQQQIAAMVGGANNPQSIVATSAFRYLPPAGIIPVAVGSNTAALDYLQFFSGLTYRTPVFVEGARLEMILRNSLRYAPIDLTSGEMFRLYLVRENREPPTSSGTQPCLIFSSGHAPDYGDAHLNVAKWGYSNYS